MMYFLRLPREEYDTALRALALAWWADSPAAHTIAVLRITSDPRTCPIAIP